MHGVLKSLANEKTGPAPEKTDAAVRAEIWAIGGGKGGVGKSLLSTGVALTLAHQGNDVVLFDADLGAANLHTLLGVPQPERTLSDFIARKFDSLNDIAVSGGHPQLALISGAGDTLQSANPRYKERVRLLSKLGTFARDVLLLDLGAGTSINTLDFFNIAHKRLVVVLPEPTSVENGYRFLRAALLRSLRQVSTHAAYLKLIDEAEQAQDARFRHVGHITERASRIEPALGQRVEARAADFRPALVLNQMREDDDLRIGQGLRHAARNLLGIDLNFLGGIPYDDTVWRAVRKRKPHVMEYPQSSAAKAVAQIVQHLRSEARSNTVQLEMKY